MVVVYYCEFLFCDGGGGLFRIRSDWSKTIDHDLWWSNDCCRDCLDNVSYWPGKSLSESILAQNKKYLKVPSKEIIAIALVYYYTSTVIITNFRKMITIQDLSFQYKKGNPLLTDVNLDLHKGKIYGLLGLNGVGKTTLLNNIAGMLFPSSGKCLLKGESTQLRSPHILSRLFIVPEQFDLPKITGQAYIDLHAFFYPDFDHGLLESVLKEFEINVLENLQELSFGQRKKFLIAFAIATQTDLLVLDEPTNGLDIPSKSQFRKIVASLDIEEKCILISTHQVRDLGSMIDHVIVLKDKSVVFNNSLEEISERLSIKKIESDSSEDYIYGEEILGGVHAIIPTSQEENGNLDLEILFNGIIQKTAEINQEFNGGKK